MIVYFTDRKLNILGQASTGLPDGPVLSNDKKSADIDTGVALFECKLHFNKKTRSKAEKYAQVGNYILRSNGEEDEFYTIIDTELDTKKQTIYIYAEDAGLDLLNEVVGEYEADKEYPITHYFEEFAYDSGFRIGTNQVADLKRKLTFDNEETVTARLASVATQFDGCEISYSFKIKRLQIVDKLIHFHKKRGQDHGTTLRLNTDIDNIIVSKTIANLATALRATGGTPDNAEDPITLRGYTYDDGDFYIDGDCLKSRSAVKKWSRYLNPNEPNPKDGHEGHIVRTFSFDTVSQETLCNETVAELKRVCDMEVNFEAEIKNLKGARIGDRINIVDEAGELYLSTRLLQLETSVEQQEIKVVLGEHLIRPSGISQKVLNLAKEFALNSKSAARALFLAKKASTDATTAQGQANTALTEAEKAQQAATDAATSANTAKQSASEAKTAADNAQSAVESVENKVTGIETTVANAKQTAEEAQQAASTAQTKANEAAENAAKALIDAAAANESVTIAQGKAEQATTTAGEAKEMAEHAAIESATAKGTADAAKADAERAKQDIESLGDQLETVSTTMEADYARKTDLTEATANLQTQISQNAAEIITTASKVQRIDETANDSQKQLQGAIAFANAAREKAEQAQADATAAQTAADEAEQAAQDAQAEANASKAAAEEAKAISDNAQAELKAALADLASVESRADATEAEIEAARQAVTAAQSAADRAKEDADTATEEAEKAQQTANSALAVANTAKAVANNAASEAAIAQAAASEASGNATAAQAEADRATQAAAVAQTYAEAATETARAAQMTANSAAEEADTAQATVEQAIRDAEKAEADLLAAEQRLADIMSSVDATEEELQEAQTAVALAQVAAEQALAEADTAQEAADNARNLADQAQETADAAQAVADQAVNDANEAQAAADEARAAVESLADRMTGAETKIRQNAEQITLTAEKTEEAIYNTSESFKKSLSEQRTAILADSKSITLSALESYVEKTDYEENKESVQAQLDMQADKIDMNFSATSERIDNVDTEIKEEVTSRAKHITFSDDGITITAGNNYMTIRIDNDLIQFERDGKAFGTWDGVNFHTGNIVIDLNQRAQIGPIAFVPRSDGSVSVLKVK